MGRKHFDLERWESIYGSAFRAVLDIQGGSELRLSEEPRADLDCEIDQLTVIETTTSNECFP